MRDLARLERGEAELPGVAGVDDAPREPDRDAVAASGSSDGNWGSHLLDAVGDRHRNGYAPSPSEAASRSGARASRARTAFCSAMSSALSASAGRVSSLTAQLDSVQVYVVVVDEAAGPTWAAMSTRAGPR